MGTSALRDRWRCLAEIHAAPSWLWRALVLENTQSELHPLEEGKHAAASGMDLKAYAEKVGKARTTLSDKVKAFRVLSVTHVRHADIRDRWRCLAEIHAAPSWLWGRLRDDPIRHITSGFADGHFWQICQKCSLLDR